jgi:hypothetical protein
MRIRYVDGYKIRNTIETDFSQWGDTVTYPFIPKGEVWIDKFMRPEKDLLLALYRLEQMMKGKPFRKIRAAAQKHFSDETAELIVVKRQTIKQLRIQYVDGASVRRKLDPYFIQGGHDLVYSYIPKNHIWIDTRQDKREFKYTLVHELHERNLMAHGMAYLDAHDFAIAAEKMARRKDGVADFIRG